MVDDGNEITLHVTQPEIDTLGALLAMAVSSREGDYTEALKIGLALDAHLAKHPTVFYSLSVKLLPSIERTEADE